MEFVILCEQYGHHSEFSCVCVCECECVCVCVCVLFIPFYLLVFMKYICQWQTTKFPF